MKVKSVDLIRLLKGLKKRYLKKKNNEIRKKNLEYSLIRLIIKILYAHTHMYIYKYTVFLKNLYTI